MKNNLKIISSGFFYVIYLWYISNIIKKLITMSNPHHEHQLFLDKTRHGSVRSLRHHLARLEMMMAEERGINLSYEKALNIVDKS